jgi:hypothetical protein
MGIITGAEGHGLRRSAKKFALACAALVLLFATVSSAHAQTTVTATWDRNTDTRTAGYRLYYGTTRGEYPWSVDAGTATSVPLTVTPGTVYYATVRAYTADYVLGPESNEVTIDLAAPTASITASLQSANSALVSWNTSNAASVVINGYSVGASGSTTVSVAGTTTFSLVATGTNGTTATASATVTAGVAAAPGTPQSLSGTVSGTRVSLAWRPPSSGGVAETYLLYAGTSSGGTDVANGLAVGNVLSAVGDLPRGRYYIRVRAANAYGRSAESNTVQLRVGKQLAVPSGFTVSWVGTTATLTWTATTGDSVEDTPTNYVLEAGTAPGMSDVASIRVGNTTSFSTDVSSGTYYVRVSATNDHGQSEPTADLVLVAPGAPNAPSGLIAIGSGPAVDLRWAEPRGGFPETGYVIEAGSAPGKSDLARLTVGNVLRFTTVAPSGVYYVRVRALNAKGPGQPSNEIMVRR